MDPAEKPIVEASAPAKLILCGEHAVVYGRPAIALPLHSMRATVQITRAPAGAGLTIVASDLGRQWNSRTAPDDPLCELVVSTLQALAVDSSFDAQISISSPIPIASGMGSGAAIATAIVRAIAQLFNTPLPPAEISRLVYGSERRFHGTPSGIDNTVVAFEQAIWFERSADPAQPPRIEPVALRGSLTIVIGDTGVRSETRLPVGDVRRRREADPARYAALFDAVGDIVAQARVALATGAITQLGELLTANHALLQQIGVSCAELDHLCAAAREAGALGTKLSGAGWGGVMLALATPSTSASVAEALAAAGARRVRVTTVGATPGPHDAATTVANS